MRRGKILSLVVVVISATMLMPGGFLPRVAAAPPNGSLFDKIVVILMENEGLQNICNRNPPPCSGTNTPYMSSLANSNTIAQNYTALAHSSMPNYVALLGGNTSSSNNLPWRNLVDLFTGAGLAWKGYMESQPDSSGCDTSTTVEPYNPDHNPFIQFQDITNNTARCSMIVRADPSGCVKTDCQLINDLNSPSPASFMWLTPNDCDNMHGSPICTNGCNTIPVTASCMTTDDTYLSTLVPNILNSTTFKNSRAALFITFDEGNGYCPANGSSADCVYTVFAGPLSKKSFVAPASHRYNHYSFLKTLESNWGLSCLVVGNDCAATVMSEFFTSSWTVQQPNLVTTPNDKTQPFVNPWAGQGFYAQGRDWVFYVNYATCNGISSNCLFYATSTNGASWTTYNIGVETGMTPSIVTNGTHVFYARYEGPDSGAGEDIMFRVGALNSNGTITWQPEVIAMLGIPNTFFYSLSMRISTSGQAFVAYQTATSAWGSGYPFVVHSNGADYSTWQQNTQLATSSDQWQESLVSLPNGQLYILYWPFWGLLRGRLWSSGTWSSEEIVTPTNTYVQNIAFGFSTGNSTVYATWQDRGTQKIQFASRNGSWGSPQTIATADTVNTPRWTASYDSLQGKWYIVYYNYTLNQIYQYSGSPGAWSQKTQLWTTQAGNSTMAVGSFYNFGRPSGTSSIVGVFWMQSNNPPSANEQLMFATETVTLL